MAQRAALPAYVTKNAVGLARAMTIALRNWGVDPPEHPAVGLAVDRPIADTTDECPELLDDRDLLQLTVSSGATGEEFKIIKQHVVDGAHLRRRMPETPALAPVVAFEHHLKQDLNGHPGRGRGRGQPDGRPRPARLFIMTTLAQPLRPLHGAPPSTP